MTDQINHVDVLNKTLTMYKEAQNFWRPVNLLRLESYDMISGVQWTKADYDYLIANRRTADVYNFLLPIALALSGTEKTNRQSLRAYPVGEGDEQLSEILTKTIRWSFDRCDKEFHFSRAWLDAVIGRFGWMKSYWSNEEDPEGLWHTAWHDPMRILIDPETQAVEFNKTCGWLFDTTWLKGEQIVNLYAGDDAEIAEAMNEQLRILEGRNGSPRMGVSWRDKFNFIMNAITGTTTDDAIDTEWMDIRNGYYRVIEQHERRHEYHQYLFDLTTGETTLIPEEVTADRELMGMIQAQNPEGMIYRRYEPVMYVTTIIPAFSAEPRAAVPQDAPYDIQNNHYMYTPVMAFDFHPDISMARSVIDNLKDPQRAYNKLESTLKDFIVRHVGHGWLVKDQSITGHEEEWESKEVGVNRVYTGDKPEPDVPPEISRAIIVGKADHRETMRGITGVSLNYTGQQETANEAASLFRQRVQQAGLMHAHMLDSARKSDKALGRWTIDGLQKYLREERWLRLNDNPGDPYWIVVNQQTINGVVNDLSIGKYDVEIDESSYTVTAKENGFMQGLALAKTMPPELVPWHLIVQNSDLPDKKGWVEYISQRMGALDSGISPELARNGLLQELMMANQKAKPGLNRELALSNY